VTVCFLLWPIPVVTLLSRSCKSLHASTTDNQLWVITYSLESQMTSVSESVSEFKAIWEVRKRDCMTAAQLHFIWTLHSNPGECLDPWFTRDS
jgi:hypothetical protein